MDCFTGNIQENTVLNQKKDVLSTGDSCQRIVTVIDVVLKKKETCIRKFESGKLHRLLIVILDFLQGTIAHRPCSNRCRHLRSLTGANIQVHAPLKVSLVPLSVSCSTVTSECANQATAYNGHETIDRHQQWIFHRCLPCFGQPG